jgi:hypothetical protein
MSIPVLVQAYEEVRRLAIAGSVVTPGDFRLKKLVPPLEQAGQKAPVFARVAEAVKRLTESSEQNSAAALLELAALISSILYTQGETGVPGELTPLPTMALGRPLTQVSARMLKPLREALTSTGSGRLEIIRDGYERGAFHDLRLIAPSLAAIDDTYAEIADLVTHTILPLYGPAIIPELQAKFDPRGRGGHARRLRLMHRLDPHAARPHVERSLEEGSSEVRLAAIGCLGDSPDDLPFLLEQAKSRGKDVRAAALKALARCPGDESARALCDAVQLVDLSLCVEGLQQSRHPSVRKAVLAEAEKQFSVLIARKESDAKKLGPQNQRMVLLLECLTGHDDARRDKLLLTMFEQRRQLAAVNGTPSGNDVVAKLLSVMATSGPGVQSALIDAHETLPADGLGRAFAAACRTREPAEVFALFSPYVTAGADLKAKRRGAAWEKREAIIARIARRWRGGGLDDEERAVQTRLDPRWLDLAVQIGAPELVQALAVPGHAGAGEFLASLVQQGLSSKGQTHEIILVLETMIRVEHPGTTDAVVDLISKGAGPESVHERDAICYWVRRLIPRLPRDEALPKLEALLPTLPATMIDKLLDSVIELKQGTPRADSI